MKDSEGIQHNWLRYWYPRDKEHIRSWWEREEWLAFPSRESDCFVQLGELSHVPCLILLGDSGLGKSVVIENGLVHEKEGSLNHVIDLRFVSSPGILSAKLEQHPTVARWQRSSDILYLYIDALDEGMLLIDSMCDLLKESFRQMDRSRLIIRITCRPGLFPPSFKSELSKLWGEKAVQAYQLAPLFLEDIRLACTDYGVEADKFLQDVKQRYMNGFVYFPVTLRMLLREYRNNGNLPSTKDRLFELGCLELCKERKKTSKPNGNFASAEKRYEVAMFLAAITVFCNKPIISNRSLGLPQEGVLDLRDWPISLRRTLGFSVEDAEEVLRSGLFREFEPMQFNWAHYSYAEFLASRFLLTQQMTVQQISSLVFNEQWNVIPQLFQTAAWLSDHSPELFELMVQHDPEILCLGDPGRWTNTAKRKVMEALLACYEQNWMYARLGRPAFYKQLYYVGVEKLLSGYLKKGWMRGPFGSFILFLIQMMDLKPCTEDLYEFMNDTFDSDMAKEALSLYIDLGDTTAKAKLASRLTEDISEFFAHKIIRALYPSLLSLEDLTAFLLSWNWFSDYTILDVLSAEDQYTLSIRLLEEEAKRGIYEGSGVLDCLIVRQAERWNEEGTAPTLRSQRIRAIGGLLAKPDAVLRHNASWEAKLRLLHCLYSDAAPESRMTACHWFQEKELPDLVELYLQTEEPAYRECLLNVISQVMNPYNEDQVSVLLPVYRRFEQGAESLHAVSLDSPVCAVMKELPIPVPSAPARRLRLLGRKTPEKRLRLLLEEAGKDACWGWPMLAEQCWPNIWEQWGKPVTQSRVWLVFNHLERERMLEAARCFLLQFDPEKYPAKLRKTDFLPIRYALQLVWELDS
ncbi:NACHT domain-containing protein [Paenibacillus hodogayensis]|uniref:NACHT domain-containing protein n=1 Tax=Paenibacillus hodogayensis TaxID=279208 RepID=A0ABV5VZP6_9BACL